MSLFVNRVHVGRLSEPTTDGVRPLPIEGIVSRARVGSKSRPTFRQALAHLAFACLLAPAARAAVVFDPAAPITDNAEPYQLPRSSSAVMALDSAGALHLVYWSGDIQTTPATPSFIYYRERSPAPPGGSGAWSAQLAIDDSEIAGQHVGGRHPSLAVGADDSVTVAWHDHRHGTAPGSYIDNVEIYGDRKPAGGVFSATDLRLTTSAAGGMGDSGYAPKIALAPDGRLTVAWHDYHADANVADVYLKSSDASGVFDLGEAMGAMRSTFAGARGGSPGYAILDLAIDAAGARRMVWCGGEGAGVPLLYGEAAAGSASVAESAIPGARTDFFDPPKIEIVPTGAPGAGDAWVAWAQESASPGAERLALARRRAGQPAFDATLAPVAANARQTWPDLAIDAAGRVHLVWVDERAGRHVRYGAWDPAAGGGLGAMIEERALTTTAATWVRPSILLERGAGYPGGVARVHVVFERILGIANGEIWYAEGKAPAAAGGAWEAYE